MRRTVVVLSAFGLLAGMFVHLPAGLGQSDETPDPVFGVSIPPGYRDWTLISVARAEGELDDVRS